MKKSVFVVLLGLASCATHHSHDTLSSVSFVDKNGFSETICSKERLRAYEKVDFLSPQPYQKVVRNCGDGAVGTGHGAIITYHDNGLTHQYLETKGGRAKGVYKEWYGNGQLKLQAEVIGGPGDIDLASIQALIFDKMTQAFDCDGNLIAAIPYDKGQLEGASTYYYPSGQVKEVIPFSKGVESGEAQKLYDDGVVAEQTNYADGVKSGMSYGFWSDGSPSFVASYSKGLLEAGEYYDKYGRCLSRVESGQGTAQIFNEEGRTAVTISNGVVEGVVKEYDFTGHLVREYGISNGEKHGAEIEYHRPTFAAADSGEPKPKLLISWSSGKIQGAVKTWYLSGQVESVREIHRNKKNGLCSAWYPDGGIMLIEEYHDDRLVKGEYYSHGRPVPVSSVQNGIGTAVLFDSGGTLVQRVEYIDGMPIG